MAMTIKEATDIHMTITALAAEISAVYTGDRSQLMTLAESAERCLDPQSMELVTKLVTACWEAALAAETTASQGEFQSRIDALRGKVARLPKSQWAMKARFGEMALRDIEHRAWMEQELEDTHRELSGGG